MEPNLNEVMSYRYVSQQELREMLHQAKEGTLVITPWFKAIAETFLFKWWDHLDNLSPFQDHYHIHRLV